MIILAAFSNLQPIEILSKVSDELKDDKDVVLAALCKTKTKRKFIKL